MIEILDESIDWCDIYHTPDYYTAHSIDYSLYIYVEDDKADEFKDYLIKHISEFNSQVLAEDSGNLELLEDNIKSYVYNGYDKDYKGKPVVEVTVTVEEVKAKVTKYEVYPQTRWDPGSIDIEWEFVDSLDDKMYVGKEFTFGGFKCKIIDTDWDYEELEGQLEEEAEYWQRIMEH